MQETVVPNTQTLYARHRHPVGALVRVPTPAPEAACLTVESALAALESVAAHPAFARPEGLTQDEVLAYALALMHLRDSAHAAGRSRLTQACDALSVTVARLIDHCASARRDQCVALTRFVAHARAMLLMPADAAGRFHTH
jgi:hypothetical protein